MVAYFPTHGAKGKEIEMRKMKGPMPNASFNNVKKHKYSMKIEMEDSYESLQVETLSSDDSDEITEVKEKNDNEKTK
eukprot:CAMPEP_0176391888 /NCGR_PEP_ID=MMETSP0126-20121128/40402_1 /TAXON_ID=141414 ORGANISM="Strombidinopsis acuminatum, Strain SPMC142" /NCGR_SAMPLE_ID=MMETSP0126 /ASSEMBLY_ACC=CAM_ASM_000229 /LENGTH=76 /DNA_ID=CAMNT_0017762303 /DNA_START=709 /DNA_END=939 /DNA_ORIENTATION=-